MQFNEIRLLLFACACWTRESLGASYSMSSLVASLQLTLTPDYSCGKKTSVVVNHTGLHFGSKFSIINPYCQGHTTVRPKNADIESLKISDRVYGAYYSPKHVNA